MPHPGTRRADFDGATPITLSPLKEAHAGQGHQAGPIYLSRDTGVSGVRCYVAQHLGGVCAFGIQGRVGVVFRDAPYAIRLVPEG